MRRGVRWNPCVPGPQSRRVPIPWQPKARVEVEMRISRSGIGLSMDVLHFLLSIAESVYPFAEAASSISMAAQG